MLNEFLKGICLDDIKGKIILHHGSRSGIKGKISHKFNGANDCSDFGPGFYMDENKEQAQTFVAGGTCPTYYKLEFNFDNLSCLHIDGLAWAFLVAYNRGWFLREHDKLLYDFMTKLVEDKDLIIGPIADDRMYDSINKFLDNDLSCGALITCLKSLNLGRQYVSKTDNADSQIIIKSIQKLSFEKCIDLKKIASVKKAKALEITKKEWEMDRKRKDKLYFIDIAEIINEKLSEKMADNAFSEFPLK